ncbi:T9SS type A sorting domain-containing protein [bacterium]|nr:T9SS type A sorting domain-containing protein [bacterium]RQV98555.1 MAG: T9SS C-terminal target domain-containing protein [bacterium]
MIRYLKRFALFYSVILLFGCQMAYSQSGTIDFEDSKWSSVVGSKLYRGGPNNTLSDQTLGVDFVIAYGEMWVTNVVGMGRMLFFSPIITSNGTIDDVGRVLIQFSSLKESVKLDVSHDYQEVHSPAYMTVKYYRDLNPNNPLYSEDIPWNGGAFTTVNYSNSTDGIQMVIVDTKYAENNLDNLEFTELGSGPSQAGTFDFNDGTDQGWTLTGAFDEDGDGPFQSNFTFDWSDLVNHPNTPFADPTGDHNGSIMCFTSSAHGISNPGASWWIMQFHSPDLSSSSTWQSATGYTVEVADAMSTDGTLYCNLYLRVYDSDQAQDRYFYTGAAQALQHYNTQAWNHLSFDWSGIANFPTNYTIREVFVNIWGSMSKGVDGGVFLDEVTPVGGLPDQTPAPPSNLQVFIISPQIHIIWEDNSDDETGFILERKDSPSINPNWQVLDVLGANVTSYQMDNPVLNHSYHFRVAAYNDHGNSNYSNEDDLSYLYTLYWIDIETPNGGEIWPPGETKQITWKTCTMNPPSHVTISYSTDGGSNWIDPPIASNISNTGSYSWTVPNTLSTNCIIQVEDATDGMPYDLSDHPFTIGTPTNPILSVEPTTLDFGKTTVSLDFEISNVGGGTLTWDVAENPEKAWITSIVPASGSGDATVSVTVDRNQLSGNSESGLISVISNGGNQNITVHIEKEETILPEQWEFTTTGNNATVILPTDANPNIDGVPLENDDYVGVFTQTGLCCGWSQWEDQNMSITVWGDNGQTPEVDGFQTGEEIDYRVYRLSEQKEWTTVSVDYSQGTGLYEVDGFMVLSQFDVSDNVTITVDFSQGWNMFSINVDPPDPSVETVMAPVVNDLVIMKNGTGQTYVPLYGINNIGDIDYKEGYKAYLSESVSLDVTGCIVDPSTAISLPGGWSMIGYLPTVSMDAEVALASIENELVIAKDGAGKTYVPEYGINQIGQMQPQQGYKIYLNSAGILTYPSGSFPKLMVRIPANQTQRVPEEVLTDHFQFTDSTSENATVVITTDIDPHYSDGLPLESGDEIGIFSSEGLCCGAIIWECANTAITIWGDDSQTPIVDGFLPGDTLHFRVWHKNSDIEYQADVTYRVGDPCVYQTDGLSVLTGFIVDLTADIQESGSLNMPSDYKMYQNYPNPFNSETAIVIELPQDSEIQLTIYDLQGHLVRRLVRETRAAGRHIVYWDGYNENEQSVSSGIYIYFVEVNEIQSSEKIFVDTKKMLLVK